jgi:hypothetical protein
MKKLGFIILALVVAIGAMGAGYAWWTQSITVNADVDNGYVQASFTHDQLTPIFADLGDTGGVAWYTETISGAVTPGDTLTVNISNAYPGMTAEIPITIRNTGTVPIGGIKGVANPSDFYLPTDSTAILTCSQLVGGLAVGASTSDAVITVTIPYGASTSDPIFVQNDKANYHFTMTITSTQFMPGTQYPYGSSTGVTAGTYGP